MRFKGYVGVAVGALLMVQGGRAETDSPPTEFISVTGGNLELNRLYETSVDLKFQVSRWSGTEQEMFQALIGPYSATEAPPSTDPTSPAEAPAPVKFMIVNRAFDGSDAGGGSPTLDPSEPGLELVLMDGQGFVYMAGVQPFGGTDGGSSTSEGTSMIVERMVLMGVPAYRVFRLQSAEDVHVKNADGEKETSAITQDFRYRYRVQGQPRFGDEVDIPDSGEIRDFVSSVLKRAKKAGLPTPEFSDTAAP